MPAYCEPCPVNRNADPPPAPTAADASRASRRASAAASPAASGAQLRARRRRVSAATTASRWARWARPCWPRRATSAQRASGRVARWSAQPATASAGERLVGARRAEQRARRSAIAPVGRRGRRRPGGRLAEDDVGVGAAEPERADPGDAPAGLAGHGRQPRSGRRSAGRAAAMCGLSSSRCRCGGIVAVLQHQHGLDEPGDAGRRLEVADVGLHRAEQQRPLGRPAAGTARRRARRPRSDRRAACRCRGPRRSRRRPAPTPASASAARDDVPPAPGRSARSARRCGRPG